MRYQLKPYQDSAVSDVLSRLAQARNLYRDNEMTTAFALTAVTGAGKTVMAAAVLESLIFGDDFREADPNAVVLWFSDSPELNAQSMMRIEQASNKLFGYMTMIDNTFRQDALDKSHIYFLNTQKLSKNSMLVRGRTENSSAYDFWRTLANTINDPHKNVYLIIDEAHRGMKASKRSERSSIVQNMINGFEDVPPTPIVWGISATISRFQETIAGMDNRTVLPPVTVSTKDVQESGLLKDIINIDFATEEGNYEGVLLRRATKTLKRVSRDWEDYCESEDFEKVHPLMVVGVKNQVSDKELDAYVAVVLEEFPDLDHDSFAHVLGDKGDIDINGYRLRHISAERVQETSEIRVLFAKEAVTTGWDCPRAEVLMSFRSAQDMDYITQIMGRIIRNPLAMRVPGNEVLNAVHAFLPKFDESSVTKVVDQLSKGGTDVQDEDSTITRKVLTHPATMEPMDNYALWETFDNMPTEYVSRAILKPVVRLMRIAHLLSAEKIVVGAGESAHKRLFGFFDGQAVQHKETFDRTMNDLRTVEGATVSVSLDSVAEGESRATKKTYTETADKAAVDDYFSAAKRVFTTDMAKSYVDYLAPCDPDDEDFDIDEFEDAVMEAKMKVTALSRIPEVTTKLNQEIEAIISEWDNRHRADIRGMNNLKKIEYNALLGASGKPEGTLLIRPDNLVVGTKIEKTVINPADGKKHTTAEDVSAYPKHILRDEDGNFPVNLNKWEQDVLATESARSNMVGWYRNPATNSGSTLSISYEDGEDNWKLLRPDFIVFNDVNGQVKPSIVDPHGTHLSDSLPKLRGLAKFAKQYGDKFYRIESIALVKGEYRKLDMMEERVQQAVTTATNVEELFTSNVSDEYR